MVAIEASSREVLAANGARPANSKIASKGMSEPLGKICSKSESSGHGCVAEGGSVISNCCKSRTDTSVRSALKPLLANARDHDLDRTDRSKVATTTATKRST